MIFYGIENKYIDVSRKTFLYNYLFHDKELKKIYIPKTDKLRSLIFGDPIYGVLKNVYINGIIYDESIDIYLDIKIKNKEELIRSFTSEEKLEMIHNNTIFTYINGDMAGDMKDEYQEQIMSTKFIREDSIVLELGSNIGRNTLTISRLLRDSKNLVSLETRGDLCSILEINRNNNKLNFHIENSALSLRPLIQHKNSWDSITLDSYDVLNSIDMKDYLLINTVSFDYLERKYLSNEKHFNTLVADCEGSLYYIFQDFPSILKHINTVIMENDYHNFEHKKYIDNFLNKNGFICVYRKPGGWEPCYECFYETWIKIF
jgi:FkbM family methyltransferase